MDANREPSYSGSVRVVEEHAPLTASDNVPVLDVYKRQDVIDRPYSRRPRFVPDMLANKLPEVYQSVCTYFGAPLRESDVSMEVCYRFLEHLPDVPVDAMPVLKSCNLLNESCRNSLAHQLTCLLYTSSSVTFPTNAVIYTFFR